MHFVDYVNPFAHGRGGVNSLVAYSADVVDAVIGGGVDLDHVEDGARKYAAAGGALVAGLAADGVFAVYGAGEDLGAGGLAGASRADEEVSVGGASGLHLAAESSRYMLLTHHVFKAEGTVFAVKGLIHKQRLPKNNLRDSEQSGTAHLPLMEPYTRY